MVQLWLHRVLVEAPISGSIIFAGVLLKVGGYIIIIIIIIITWKPDYFFYFLVRCRKAG